MTTIAFCRCMFSVGINCLRLICVHQKLMRPSMPEWFWCDKNEVKYIVGLAKNPRLPELSKDLQIKAEALYNGTHEKAKLFADSKCAAGTWKYPHRVIAKAEFNSFGPNNRFIVTNLEDDGHFFMKKSIVPEERWKTGSRNNSWVFSLIGRAAMTLRQIKSDFCLQVWRTFLWNGFEPCFWMEQNWLRQPVDASGCSWWKLELPFVAIPEKSTSLFQALVRIRNCCAWSSQRSLPWNNRLESCLRLADQQWGKGGVWSIYGIKGWIFLKKSKLQAQEKHFSQNWEFHAIFRLDCVHTIESMVIAKRIKPANMISSLS